MSAGSLVDTRWVQRSLKEAGFYSGKVDGDFGPKTEGALKQYLASKGLPDSVASRVAAELRASAAGARRPAAPQPPTQEQLAKAAQKADKAGAAARGKFSPAKPASRRPCPKFKCPPGGSLGSLSAQYESGKRGSAAIGYDNTGGWSYGKYQIETKRGTMKSFLAFAGEKSPETARRLEQAGGNDAALKGKQEFKDAWEDLAREPGFTDLQHDFIAHKNYDPLAAKVQEDTGLDVGARSGAVKDVVWSVAVQHGPKSEVVTRALKGKDVEHMTDEEIIDAIYDERSAEKTNEDGEKVLKYFSKSTEDVQAGVRKRFGQERFCAKQMLAAERAAQP